MTNATITVPSVKSCTNCFGKGGWRKYGAVAGDPNGWVRCRTCKSKGKL